MAQKAKDPETSDLSTKTVTADPKHNAARPIMAIGMKIACPRLLV